MSTAPTRELLQDRPGSVACMLGNHAIVRGALEAGVQFYSCYPGTPSSEIGDTFARIAGQAGVLFEYSINEKVAVEIAFAAALTGARSMCGMKHLGLNYAGDPLSTMPYVGVEGGMVIVSAGDPSALTSPNEQDQRHFCRFLYLPVLDPATPNDALQMTRYGFELSERTRLPVLLRPTTRVCHVSGIVYSSPLPARKNTIAFRKDPPRYVPIPRNAQRMRKELSLRFALAENLLGESPFFPRIGEGPYGILGSGVAFTYLSQIIEELGIEDRVTLLQIGAYPIPERILTSFLESVDSVLVVEELTPFVEEWVTRSAYRLGKILPIFGKGSGHFPVEFEYNPDMVEDAVRSYVHLKGRRSTPVPVSDLPSRPPTLCPGCPHRTSFYLVRKVFGKQTVYCNDIGCYTLGYGEPLHSCDVLLCMGSSISQASGIARMTKKRTVAFIGDSTFFHSGLPALANAVQNNDTVTVCILNNYVTAMTGFQPSFTGSLDARERDPASDRPRTGLSIEEAVRGIGVTEIHSVYPFDEAGTLEALRAAKSGTGLNVVICNAPCVVNERRLRIHEPRAPYVIDQELCNACSLCVRVLGCPAIHVEDGRYSIERNLCDGCELCADVCNQNAIRQAEGEPL